LSCSGVLVLRECPAATGRPRWGSPEAQSSGATERRASIWAWFSRSSCSMRCPSSFSRSARRRFSIICMRFRA